MLTKMILMIVLCVLVVQIQCAPTPWLHLPIFPQTFRQVVSNTAGIEPVSSEPKPDFSIQNNIAKISNLKDSDKKKIIFGNILSSETTLPNYGPKKSGKEISLIDETILSIRPETSPPTTHPLPSHTSHPPRLSEKPEMKPLGQSDGMLQKDANSAVKLINFESGKVAQGSNKLPSNTMPLVVKSKIIETPGVNVMNFKVSHEKSAKENKNIIADVITADDASANMPTTVSYRLPSLATLKRKERMMSGFVSDDREQTRLDAKTRFRRRLELLLSHYPESQRESKRQALVKQLLDLSSQLQQQINSRDRDRRARIL